MLTFKSLLKQHSVRCFLYLVAFDRRLVRLADAAETQDNTNFRLSDPIAIRQRHRFVFSGVFLRRRMNGNLRVDSNRSCEAFLWLQIVELVFGSSFNILASGMPMATFQSTNERPTVLSDGKCALPALMPDVCKASFRQTIPGSQHGITHSYFSFDGRLTGKSTR